MFQVENSVKAKPFVNSDKSLGTIVLEGKLGTQLILHGTSSNITGSVTGKEVCNKHGTLTFQIKRGSVGVVAITAISDGSKNQRGDSFLLEMKFQHADDLPHITLENIWISPLHRPAQVSYHGLTTMVGKIQVATKGALKENERQLLVTPNKICDYLIGKIGLAELIKDAKSVGMTVPEEVFNQLLAGSEGKSIAEQEAILRALSEAIWGERTDQLPVELEEAEVMEALEDAVLEESALAQLQEAQAEIESLNIKLKMERASHKDLEFRHNALQTDHALLRERLWKIRSLAHESYLREEKTKNPLANFIDRRKRKRALELALMDELSRNIT